MRKRIIGGLAVAGATAGLLVAGAGIASADPSCLEESFSGAVADPLGALVGVLNDPLGSAQADLQCAQEVLGH
jgi:hypothetical protein